MIFYNEKTPFKAIKTWSPKSREIWHFCKGFNPWFWSKNGHFSKFLFFANLGQENAFYLILERENGFLGYKNKMFKNWHFCNFFFLANLGHGNIFYDILEQKKPYLGYKNNKFKKLKNWHFCDGVNPWFWSKNGHFSNFFF